MTITIEPFAPAHQAGLEALVLGIQQTEFSIPVTREEQPDLCDVEGFFRSAAGNFWIARDGERVVGSIGARDIGDGAFALRKMFVAREYRGATLGVARDLLAGLLAWVRAHGGRVVYLGTTEFFHAAHRFYERSGFSIVDAGDLPASFPRVHVDNRFYVMRF